MAITRPKGTQDHLPDGSPKLTLDTRAAAFEFVRQTAQRVLTRAGAQFIDTPLFEEAELVKRGVGGSTDIVRKETFTVHYFGNHGGYILRPEGTAGIVRAYLQNGLKQLPTPLKMWTHGPMFRAENVQRLRLRQFHQVDYEVLGSADPLVDAEAISLLVEVVRALGLKQVRVKLGSIGDPEDRAAYNAYLRTLFIPHLARLSEDGQARLERNPMRILDGKAPGDQDLIAELGVRPMLDFLGADARAHFEAVQAHLDAWAVPYDIDPSIVRGLDYYRRTAWELHHEGVGAKSALCGGGRYDGLAQDLGSKEPVPGIGWAFGIERLLGAMEADGVTVPGAGGPALYLAAMDPEHVGYAARLALQARASARVEFAYRAQKPGHTFRDAERRGATWAGVIGSDEAARGVLSLKHLTTGETRDVAAGDLAAFLSSEHA